jgi:predicted phage terminase large subunit-like protein
MHAAGLLFSGASDTAPKPATPEEAFYLQFLSNPQLAMVEIDQRLVEKEGLRGFIKLGWHTVEQESTFKTNWHIDAICDHLEAVSCGDIRRLIIACPPRHMKSLSVAVMWPAWDWIENPWRRFLFASYAHNLSIRDSVRCRSVLSSPWFRARWGDCFQLTGDQNTKIRFTNDKTGQRLSTSVGGQLTGEGGDIIGIDDSQNSLTADSPAAGEKVIKWWRESMSTRLSNPQKGAYVLIQQRLKADDLIGHVISKHGLVQNGGEYYCLCLPARYEHDHPQRWFRDPRTEDGQVLWPNHIDEDTLRSLELALGPYAAAGQLQQRPTAREGGYFKRHWLTGNLVKTAQPDTVWMRAWDLAASEAKITKSDPDYTASALVGYSAQRGKWIIGHVERFREGPGEVKRRMLARANADRAKYGYHRIAFPQDPGQAGKDQARELGKLLAAFSFECRPVTGKKVERATPLAGQAELGMVELLDSSEQSGEEDWNRTFLDELCSFPAGVHDDMVDAVTTAYNAITGGTTGLIEYYERKLRAKREAEAAAKAGPQQPGYRVVTGETTNMAQANTLTGQRKPPST